jgi:hypothetical protein
MTNSALLAQANRALAAESARRARVQELRDQHERLVAHTNSIIAERDHKNDQIPLSEREHRMYWRRVALAENAEQKVFDELMSIVEDRDL